MDAVRVAEGREEPVGFPFLRQRGGEGVAASHFVSGLEDGGLAGQREVVRCGFRSQISRKHTVDMRMLLKKDSRLNNQIRFQSSFTVMNNDDAVSPQVLVMQLLTTKVAAQALTQAAELGVADQLRQGPRPVAELADSLKVSEDALYRVLRALAGVGFFVEHPGRTFSNNENSEILRTGVPGSMRAMARWLGEESSWWKAWGQLSHSLRTGRPAAEVVFGGTTFDFFSRTPRVNEIFQSAMTDFSAVAAKAVAMAYDFAAVKRVVDVGGGHGTLLAAILEASPEATGVLFDLPEVLAGADATLEASGQSNRIEKVAGNFLEMVPADGDLYIMKHIIHDWDDARCITLLQNCRRAMKPGGRVLIVEHVITDQPESTMAKLLDLEMLVMTPGGRERTDQEFRELLQKAGLELERIIPTESPVCVLEAVAAQPADDSHPSHLRSADSLQREPVLA
jgi:SAM-dependent methyltransferase